MKKATLRATASAFALLGAGIASTTMVAAEAAAQDYTSAALSGTVTDEGGAVVSGATVQLVSLDLGFTRSATTGSNGTFRYSAVPPGNYDLVVSRDGTEVYRAEGVRLLASQSANVDVVVPGGAVGEGEAIVIQGSQLINDFEGTTTGLNVDVEDLVKTVPLGRDLTSVVLLAPGTTQGDSAFGNLASIGGSSVAENAYYINGLNVTNFDNYLGSARVPFDMYRSVEVKSGGYPAEFGRATGGIVNAVTKSGSNDFFGGVHLDWSPNWAAAGGKDRDNCSYDDQQAGNPASPFFGADPSDPIVCERLTNRSLDETDAYSAVLEAGGPIIRDHLFLYGILEFRDTETVTVNRATGLATRNTQDDPFWGLKADFYPIDSQHFEFTIFDTKRQTLQSAAPYVESDLGESIGDYNQTGIANFGGISYVGKWTGRFTDFLTLSAAYGRMNDRFDNSAVGAGAALPIVINASGGTVDGVPNGGLGNDQTVTSVSTPYETQREFFRADADLYFNLLGDHHVRGGWERENTELLRGTVRNGNPYLTANGLITPAAATAGAGNAGYAILLRPGNIFEVNYFNSGGAFTGENNAYYLQDEWNVTDRLTLNLGVRRDDFKLFAADGSEFLSLSENYAPRLGFTYDLWPEQNGKLFGFYGQYFLPVASNTAFRAAGTEYYARERFFYDGTLNADGIPTPISQLGAADDPSYDDACPFAIHPFGSGGSNCNVTGDGSVPSSEEFFASNLEATKETEWLVGYEHDFGGFTAGITYIHRNLDVTAEDAAIDAAANTYCQSFGYSAAQCSSVWTGYHQYVTFNVGNEATFKLLGDDSLCVDTPELCDFVTFSADELGLPAARRKYDAVELSFNRPFDGLWRLGGSYTWSRSRGNSEGYVQSDFGQDDAGITQDFDQPGFTDYADGRLPNDRTHRFKLFGSYALMENLVLGTNISVTSPRPLSCFGLHPTDQFANGYGAASHYCGLQPAPRGEGSETDWLTNIDLQASYTHDFGAERLVRFGIDVFNVFNSQAVTQRNEFGEFDTPCTLEGQVVGGGCNQSNALVTGGNPTSVIPNPNYDIPTGYQAPRSVRFSMDVTF